MKWKQTKPLFGLALAAALLFGGCYSASLIHVADGYRDSTIRKLSESGIIWKTWEVESLGDGSSDVLTDAFLQPDVHSGQVVVWTHERRHRSLRARICAGCGQTELFVTNPETLLKAKKKRTAPPSRRPCAGRYSKARNPDP